jgi:hypothetical protein
MLEGLTGYQPGDHVCVSKVKAFLLPGEEASTPLVSGPNAPEWWPAVVEEQRGPRVYVLRLLPQIGVDPGGVRVMAPASAMLRLGDEQCHGGLFPTEDGTPRWPA